MIPSEIIHSLEKFFLSKGQSAFQISKENSLGGGSINQASKIESNYGHFFIKWNLREKFPKMFEKEAIGLNHLASTKAINIATVVHHEELVQYSYLLLEWIESSSPTPEFWKIFAQKMAALHQHKFEKFGFEQDNFIGSLIQKNNWTADCSDFFWGQRIEPLLQKARNAGYADRGDVQSFDNLYYKLDKIIPEESPSLLHGDFWQGNFKVDSFGMPCLIDPATYYGHREMDIAMSSLFSGFSPEFYQEYNTVYRLESDWDERLDLWNLYPLLVHVNIFGESYMNELRRNVRRFM